MLSIDLNGAWHFQPDWQSSRITQLPNGLFKKDEWLRATVPGTVHTDLMAAEKIPDPFYRDNESRVQWVSEIGWCYRRTFQVPAEFLQSAAMQLVAEGLDTFANVFINGRPVAETQNMFIPRRFEVNSWLRAGENEIEIRFDSPLQRAQELEAQYGRLPVALESYRVYARKAQYSFSWDWGPKLATSGIWRPIRLECCRNLRLNDIFVEVNLDDDLQSARITTKIEIEKFSNEAVEFLVEISAPDFHASKRLHAAEDKFSVDFSIEKPRLWWPAGYGDQPIYVATVTARVGDEITDRRSTRFGIRSLELVREKDASGESFLFRVNNVPIFCKGADWIPADSFIPRISDKKYRSLLIMARTAQMNMLRVWGGGIYEQDIFYDLCDELGILVWQDFMFACGGYPEYPEFVDNVRHEVTAIVKRLRNHPSLALWCGNNENEWLWNMETARPYREMPGVSLFEKVIPEICGAHDPVRPYWQSSPFGGKDPNDASQGDRHQWNIWSNWADPSTVANDRGRFLSEFGFQAPASLAAWEKVLDTDDRQPQSPVFEHHNKQVEGPERLHRYLAGHVNLPVDFEDFVYKTQIVQAEALKTMVEHWRSEKFHTAGALFWQLNDCWPVSSWAVIDSELQPKAAYWYARRFFAPVMVSFKPAGKFVEVWVTNDTLKTLEAELELSVLTFSGEISFMRHEPVLISANRSVRLAAPVFAEFLPINPRQQYVRARLKADGRIIAENRYFFSRYKHLELPSPHLNCRVEKIAGTDWRVNIKTDFFIKNLALPMPPSGTALSDNYFDLDANGEMTIVITGLPEQRILSMEDLKWKWLT